MTEPGETAAAAPKGINNSQAKGPVHDETLDSACIAEWAHRRSNPALRGISQVMERRPWISGFIVSIFIL